MCKEGPAVEIQMLTGKALALLKVNAEDNKEKYCQPQSFIHEYLPTLEGMGQYCFGSTIIGPLSRFSAK